MQLQNRYSELNILCDKRENQFYVELKNHEREIADLKDQLREVKTTIDNYTKPNFLEKCDTKLDIVIHGLKLDQPELV